MDALTLQRPGLFEWLRVKKPETLRPGEALLKVHRVGICGTDFHAYEGKQNFFTFPRILGHELGVEVVAVAEDVTHVKPGDRCTVAPFRNPTATPAVRRGKPNCGEQLSVLGVHEDGGMRPFLAFPARNLHVSETLSYEQLAFVEPLCIGCHAVNRARVTEDDTVLIIGTGTIGLTTIVSARLTGARIAATDINPHRIAFCRGAFPDIHAFRASEDLADDIRAIFGGELPTVVFDATGNAASMMHAFDLVAHGGTLVFIGHTRDDITFHNPDFHRKELTLMASRNALGSDFEQIIRAMESGRIDPTPWITHQVPFEAMIDHFDTWLQPNSGVIKAMLTLD
jgi:alcohol dehydrogenase